LVPVLLALQREGVISEDVPGKLSLEIDAERTGLDEQVLRNSPTQERVVQADTQCENKKDQ